MNGDCCRWCRLTDESDERCSNTGAMSAAVVSRTCRVARSGRDVADMSGSEDEVT